MMAKLSVFLKTDLPNKTTTKSQLVNAIGMDVIMTDRVATATHTLSLADYHGINNQTILGEPYEAIVRKCLQCNFGYGTNLGCTELQAAIYNSVVCPLQETIEKLELIGQRQ
ncbi:hypothetical protein F5B21DRAFT_358374 [Xylaria acuta]|nr:hypothetical protein F5B21DRAFT_358374 [Xylaria acuta]